MQSHQRYFPVEDASGKLLPNFVVINNGNPEYSDLIRKGHERVIKARLADAKYFFESDSSKPLESYNEKLKGVTLQVKLGTVYQKIERDVKIAGEIAHKLALSQTEIDYAVRAAYLCKADLVTEMVFEFPDLQGVMGREYAGPSGEPQQVAEAIFEHYLPRSSGDILPQTITGQVVSIADKLDSICGILAAGLVPSGSEDPYALRRQAQGIVSIILDNRLDLSMKTLIFLVLGLYEEQGVKFEMTTVADLAEEFIKGRLRAYLLGQGLPLDAVDAVGSIELDDMVDIKRRAEAVASKLGTHEIADLLFAVTRCKNLAKTGEALKVDAGLLQEDAEKELYDNLVRVDKELTSAGDDYAACIDILAGLREPVNKFFDNVLVMAKDEAVKSNRVALLNFAMNLFRRVADFSNISSPAS
jgi:glycyl-tRNA synthetase beta chain